MSVESEGARLSRLQDDLAQVCLEHGYTEAATILVQQYDEQTWLDLAMVNIAKRAQDLEQL